MIEFVLFKCTDICQINLIYFFKVYILYTEEIEISKKKYIKKYSIWFGVIDFFFLLYSTLDGYENTNWNILSCQSNIKSELVNQSKNNIMCYSYCCHRQMK